MSRTEHYRRLERLYHRAPTNEYYQPRMEVGDGEARVTISVRQDMWHAAGAAHGAVYFKAMDDAAFFAANSLVTDVFVLTLSLTVYFLRPVSSGTITATGRVVQPGRRLLVAESVLQDDAGRDIGRANGIFVRSEIPLGPEIGYG